LAQVQLQGVPRVPSVANLFRTLCLHINMPFCDYQKVRQIGSGSFGCAYLVSCGRAADKEKKLLVMKEVDISRMGSREKKNAEVEVQVLASLKHPYIVRYTESFVHDQMLCIVMDYCEGGDLGQYVAQRKRHRSSIAEPQVVRWFTQMCLALKHVHDKNIIHRDIKAQNIFLAKRESRSEPGSLGCVKIADFGIAKVLDSTTSLARTQVGTPYYLSPEICQKQPYAAPSDMWALGCVIYELCALRVPFEANDLPHLVDKIVRGPTAKIPTPQFSRELSDLVGELLLRMPNQRPTAEKVLQKTMMQAEIKRMIEENKKPSKNGENEDNGRLHSARERPSSARSHSQQPRSDQPRGILQERNHSHDHCERRSSSKPAHASPRGGRAASPRHEAAKQILRPSRGPSPSQQRPSSARREYQPLSAREYRRH